MAYNERKMLEDVNGDLIPQFYDPVEDVFKPLTNDPRDVRLTGSNAELELRSRNELYYDGSGLTLAPGESLLIGERYDRIETRLPILMISYRAELRDSLENYSAVVSSYNTNGILRETYSESIELEMNTPTARTFFLARGDVKNNYIEIQISNESDEERSISEITVREVLF